MIRKFQRAPPPAPKPARRNKPEMTLDRALSRAGVASRAAAAALIAAGRVSVEGRVLRDPQAWVAPARQPIRLDGQPLRRPRPVYFALHKPVGYITSHGDPCGRPTIYDLLTGAGPSAASPRGPLMPRDCGWLFSVGRLDQDSSGLLLVTNDSVFAERIANPVAKVPKTYHVRSDSPLTPAEVARLRAGLEIGRGERSGPARVRPLPLRAGEHWLEIEIREGKNRQVRRMLEAVGRRVLALTRVRIGKLALGNLPAGKIRHIRPRDVL
ncbi:MAG: pseudouridine synthase [Terriglobales bacterium]